MKILGPAGEDVWWEVARGCAYATFFHTPLWHRLAESTSSAYRDVTFVAELGSGVRAVFPLLLRRPRLFGLLGEAVSTFAGCYGGPIADGPMTGADRRLLYEAADGAAGRVALAGNPLSEPGPAPAGFGVVTDSTHLLRLDAPFETLFSRFSKGHRSSTRRGSAVGVSVRRASSVADYRAYFGIYEGALDRWGEESTSAYPWSLFERGHQLSERHDDRIILWLGELDGRVVAGAWVFYWNRHATYWHGAADEAGREAAATNVVLSHVIEDAGLRGMEWFDFNPSGGHEGVAAFKRRFGAEPVEFVRYRKARLAARVIDSARALVRRQGRWDG